MFEEIMASALGNGLWASLFCMLFLYQLKDSRAREKKYCDAIESLTDSVGKVKEIKEDCVAISATVVEVKQDCKTIKSDCTLIKNGVRAVRRDKKQEKSDKRPIAPKKSEETL